MLEFLTSLHHGEKFKVGSLPFRPPLKIQLQSFVGAKSDLFNELMRPFLAE